jgi:uncharacterized repeat protein (TIGR04076 family)
MFKVKITVVGFDKDEKKYPCHFRYKIGEEITFDGEVLSGRICPNMLPEFGRLTKDIFASGGRHKEGEAAASYYPFWHSPLSIADQSYKKYDGVGFRPTLERPEENYKFIADETLFDNPPGGKYIIGKGTAKRDFFLVCNDSHTYARFKVEAYDLADKGDSLPYYRRAMSILDKIIKKPGININEIIKEFSKDDLENIYPTLGQKIISILVGELEFLDYVTVKNDAVTATAKGKDKLKSYIAGLTNEEKNALKL